MPPAFEVLLLNTAVPQIQAAQAGDTYVVPRDIAFSAALTLSAGTANGVPYLNGSKVLTTGSALTFDGTKLINTSGVAGALIQSTDTGGSGSFLRMLGDASSGNLINWTTGTALRFATSADNFGSFAEQMRLTSTGLGIGTSSPTTKLTVYAGADGDVGFFRGGSTRQVQIGTSSTAGYINTDNGSAGLELRTQGTARMYVDNSGNLGLGVTPSAWAAYKALQVASIGGALSSSSSSDLEITTNAYYNAGWLSQGAGVASSRYRLNAGTHAWFTAPSGTAGDPISFGGAKMTLDASGNLLVGNTVDTGVGSFIYPSGYIRLNTAGTVLAQLRYSGSSVGTINTDGANIQYNAQAALVFGTNGTTERARITSGGDFQTSSGNSVMVGGTAARATTAGTNRVDIFDGTAPVGTLANGVSFYSASGEANVMDAAGNATLLSPHDAATNEWIFRSKHTPTGKVLKIDVERLLKFVNDHFGLDAVHEFIED